MILWHHRKQHPGRRRNVEASMARGKKKSGEVSRERVMEELVAIGFAKVTDFLCVKNDELVIKSTDALTPEAEAAIASIERTSQGLKVKFYDKLKALELLGKHMGMFDGKGQQEAPQNNLLEEIIKATQKEMDIRDISELQQAADSGDDLVESPGAKGL